MIKALVLAGGTGTRLRPLTSTMPKQLLPVANKPVLNYIMEKIAGAGIGEVGVVVSGESGAGIRETVGDGGQWGIRIVYITQDRPGGLAHAVTAARDFLRGTPFMMHLGDNLLQGSLDGMLELYNRRSPDAVVLTRKVDDPGRYGVARVDGTGRVLQLVEKPSRFVSDLALVGVYVFSEAIHAAIDGIKASARGELEITDAIQKLVETGGNVISVPHTGWWFDTGSPADLLAANRTLLGEICAKNDWECLMGNRIYSSIIKGPVVLGANVEIWNSFIGPYTSIGDSCRIEGARVEDSIIMEGSQLEGMIEFKGGIAGKNCRIRNDQAMWITLKAVFGEWSSVEILNEGQKP